MSLPGVYRMSENEIVELLVEDNMANNHPSELYSPIISSYHFYRMASSRRSVPVSTLGIEDACCSIVDVHVVIQVVQNWFTGIRIQSRVSRLG